MSNWFACWRACGLGLLGIGKSPATLEELNRSLRSLCEVKSKTGGAAIGFLFTLPGSTAKYIMTSRMAVSNSLAARDAVAYFPGGVDLSLDPDSFFESREFVNVDSGKEIRFESTVVGVTDFQVRFCHPLELSLKDAFELHDQTVAHLQFTRENGKKSVVLGSVHSVHGNMFADDSSPLKGQSVCPVLDVTGDVIGVQTATSNVAVLLKPFLESIGLVAGGSAPPPRRPLPPASLPPPPAYGAAGSQPISASQRSAGWSSYGEEELGRTSAYGRSSVYGRDSILPSSTANYSATNSPAVTPSRGLPKGCTEQTVVFIKESTRTPGLRTFHFRPDCGGNEKNGTSTVREARTKGCRQCERCTPRSGGTGLEELRALKALFGSKRAGHHAAFAGSRSMPSYNRLSS